MLLISLLIHRVMLTLTLRTMLATTVVGETNTNALFFKNSTRINMTCTNFFPHVFKVGLSGSFQDQLNF